MSLGLVRFNALHQIESYDPQLVKFTVSSFDFRFCNITCQVGNLRVNCRLKNLCLKQKINICFTIKKKKYFFFIILQKMHKKKLLFFKSKG